MKKDNNELNMDDIQSIASEACDNIVLALRQYKISVSEEEMLDIVEDDIFEAIRSNLEEISNGNYPSQMG